MCNSAIQIVFFQTVPSTSLVKILEKRLIRRLVAARKVFNLLLPFYHFPFVADSCDSLYQPKYLKSLARYVPEEDSIKEVRLNVSSFKECGLMCRFF